MSTIKLPQFVIIRNYLEQMIAAKRMGPNAKLPSERVIAAELNTTRVTLREALRQLEGDGIIYRQDRRGWFVTPHRISYDPTKQIGFMDYVKAQGNQPKTQVIEIDFIKATAELAAIFTIDEQMQVFRLRRLRFIDNREVLYEQIYLRADFFPGLENIDFSHSLTTALKAQYGTLFSKQHVISHLITLQNTVARALLVVSGTPGLCIKRKIYDDQDRVFEYDEEYWRPEACQLQMSVNL
ncbi:UTRA domain-containing protein [Paraglaciecola sp.]|uniref:UTRA domain-containing protein n=1 Tax=Paraglaciecola sp. TaxID=1920173 RepID=UPI0030F39474